MIKRKPRLKLYVWTDFCPDYTSGLAFAVARSVEEARNLVRDKRGAPPLEWGKLEIFDLNKEVAFCVSGGG